MTAVYSWVDTIPLSRVKKNIARDFSDGVLLSEVINHFMPKLVELHNYVPTNNLTQKLVNWRTLNQKVFRKLGFVLSADDIQSAAQAEKGCIERILAFLKPKLEQSTDQMNSQPVSQPQTQLAPASTASHIEHQSKSSSNPSIEHQPKINANLSLQSRIAPSIPSGPLLMMPSSGQSERRTRSTYPEPSNLRTDSTPPAPPVDAKDVIIQDLKETIEVRSRV